MEADPDGSMKYFSSAASSQEDDDEFGQSLTAIKSKEQFEKVIQSGKPIVVRCEPAAVLVCRACGPSDAFWPRGHPSACTARNSALLYGVLCMSGTAAAIYRSAGQARHRHLCHARPGRLHGGLVR